MQEQDISQLPVFEETNIVGTIYEDQMLNLALQGKDLRKLVHPRSDEQAAAAGAVRRAGRARHLSAEPRRAGGVCGDEAMAGAKFLPSTT